MCEEHPGTPGSGPPHRRHVLALLGIGALTAACGSAATRGEAETGSGTSETAGGSGGGEAAPASNGDLSVKAPGKLTQPLLSSDVLVYSQDSLPEKAVERIRAIDDVQVVEPMAMASFYVDDTQVTYAAVDPGSFRRFTQAGTAQTQEVWDRVAGGEIAIEPALGKKLQDKDGYVRIGNEEGAKKIHVGALAGLLPPNVARRIDAVVNTRWIEELQASGMKPGNAVLLGMGSPSPQSIRKKLNGIAGDDASVQILGPDLDLGAAQTAVLVGGSVSAAVGSFSYTANPDGTVNPDASWVKANITSMAMPIIGNVTGHRVMLPQLRAALNDVVAAGLSKAIYTYDGCYVPRFIARDPSKGLSFHTFGTAIDLNAADNYRGIAGKMDRTVVAIFKRWGFAWGGDWGYTDPMHFELARLVKAG